MTWEPLTLESQTATQEAIEALIGLSRATFRASSYLAQGDVGAFCDALPSARKAILAEVIGLADWDRWLERARADRRASELRIAEGRALLERADIELSQREAIADEQGEAREREQRYRAELEEQATELASARERLTEARQRDERRAAAVTAQNAAQSAVAELKIRIANRESEISDLDARLAERDDLAKLSAGLLPLQTEREQLQAAAVKWQERERLAGEAARNHQLQERAVEEAFRLEEQAEKVLQGIGQDHCDRCGQVLGEDAARRAAESYRSEAAGHREQAESLKTQSAELGAQLAELPSEPPDQARLQVLYDGIRQAQDASTRLAALEEAAARRDAASRELDAMRAELPTRERAAAVTLADVEALGPHDPSVAERAKAAVENLERLDRDLRGLLEQVVRQISRCDERLERLRAVEHEADETRGHVDDLLGRLEVQAAMERACSANGIPALILESIAIPQVEAEATRLLRVLGGPATAVELRTLRETKTAGIAETLDIVLQTDTGEAHYETFSGGEKARIAFALRLALAQLLSARKGADTGLLVIDEIDGLDAAGIAALVGVLEDLQRSVPRIVVVSHDAELRDAFPQTLLLENIDGRSRVVQTLNPPTALEV